MFIKANITNKGKIYIVNPNLWIPKEKVKKQEADYINLLIVFSSQQTSAKMCDIYDVWQYIYIYISL